MYKNKPTRQPGQDARDFPTYTVPEAARFLAIPQRTLLGWFTRDNHLLVPSAKAGNIPLLSFWDLSEAYVLEVLRTVYGFRLQSLRDVLTNIKRETKIKRPLVDAELKVVFSSIVLDKPARGRLPRRCIDLVQHRNFVLPGIVDIVGKRVLRDSNNNPYRLHPWRFLTPDDDSRPVTMDPQIMSGRAVITGTRIPVSAVFGMAESGKTLEQIARGYNLKEEIVRKAIQHLGNPLQKVA